MTRSVTTRSAKKNAKTLPASVFSIRIEHPNGHAEKTEMYIKGERSYLFLSQAALLETQAHEHKDSLLFYLFKVFVTATKLRLNRNKALRNQEKKRKAIENQLTETEKKQEEVRNSIKNKL